MARSRSEEMTAAGQGTLTHILAAAFFAASLFFVHRSFYGMRIETQST